MQNLKEYEHLHRMYQTSIRKFKIPFFVCLLLFLLAFPTLMLYGFPFGLSMFMLFMIFPAILFAVLWAIASIKTKNQLKPFTALQLNYINNEITSCSSCEGFFVTSEAVVYNKIGLQLIPMDNILWVYPLTTTTWLNFIIPIHKDTMLMFAGKDQKTRGFYVKNKGDAYTFLQSELFKHRLDIIFGYEKEMENIYNSDLNRMIAFSQESAEKLRETMQKG